MTTSTLHLRPLVPLWTAAGAAVLVGRAAGLAVPRDPLGWLSTTSTDAAVPVLLWLTTAGVASWLALTSTLQALLRRTTGSRSRRRAIRWLDRVTPRVARAVALRAVGATTVAAVGLGGPAIAQPVPPGVRPPTVQVVPTPTTPTAPAPPSTTTPHATSTHTVVAGDHFWSIAAVQVTRVLGRPPTNVEIAPYWRLLVARNASSVPSGDVDLIRPGERYDLPTWEPPPA